MQKNQSREIMAARRATTPITMPTIAPVARAGEVPVRPVRPWGEAVEEGDGTTDVTMPAGIEAVAEEDTLGEGVDREAVTVDDRLLMSATSLSDSPVSGLLFAALLRVSTRTHNVFCRFYILTLD
jgi:hypothetical protein